MRYQYPFGEYVQTLVQEDRSPKKVFVLGVYASAVHARWKKGGTVVCQALAVASEPRIFWDGNLEEAKEIIGRIRIPEELGTLEPAEMINCTGCRIEGVKTYFCDSLCSIRQCALSRAVESCGNCIEMNTCEKLEMVTGNNAEALDRLTKMSRK